MVPSRAVKTSVVVLFSVQAVGYLAAEHSEVAVMMTTKRLDNFEVVCEWASCNFKGRTMEELSDHMFLHLKDYLGDNDALEDLGE